MITPLTPRSFTSGLVLAWAGIYTHTPQTRPPQGAAATAAMFRGSRCCRYIELGPSAPAPGHTRTHYGHFDILMGRNAEEVGARVCSVCVCVCVCVHVHVSGKHNARACTCRCMYTRGAACMSGLASRSKAIVDLRRRCFRCCRTGWTSRTGAPRTMRRRPPRWQPARGARRRQRPTPPVTSTSSTSTSPPTRRTTPPTRATSTSSINNTSSSRWCRNRSTATSAAMPLTAAVAAAAVAAEAAAGLRRRRR